jgi:hypothetical protein
VSILALPWSLQIADLRNSYEGDDAPAKPSQPAPAVKAEPQPIKTEPVEQSAHDEASHDVYGMDGVNQGAGYGDMGGATWNGNGNQQYDDAPGGHEEDYGPINIKEDG